MEFLKKNGLVILSLSLCAVLTAALVRQSTEVNALRQENAALTARLDEADTALENLRSDLEQPAPSARFLRTSVNAENHFMTADIMAVLPEEQERNPAIGLCCPGEPYSLAWKYDYLQQEADGTYSGTVIFPLDLDMGLELRLEDDTVLFSTDTVKTLLPLQWDCGWTAWHYNCQAQLFSQCDWDAALTDLDGNAAQTEEGTFRAYRNGILVFTGREVPDSSRVEVDGELLDYLELACAPGDRMRLTYACTDASGLRYEFPVCELLAMNWDDMEECPLSNLPTVTWPE